MEIFHTMIWVIVILVLGIIAIIVYRFYYFPPLSQAAKQQQAKYIRAFQEEKTLIYQMAVEEQVALRAKLQQTFFDAGFNAFYGQHAMIHLKTEDTQVSIQIFSDDPHDLTRTVWRILHLQDEIGGSDIAAADG